MSNDITISAVASNIAISMTSREIAELTGKRHDHVLRDIREMLAQAYDFKDNPALGYQQIQGVTEETDQHTKRTSMYRLDKDHTLTLLTGYDAKSRLRVVKRWQELEVQVKSQNALAGVTTNEFMQGIAKLVDERIALAIANDPRVAAIHCLSAKDVCTRLKISSKGRGKLVAALSHKLSSWCMGTSQTITHCPRSGVRLFPTSAVDSWLVRGGKEWVHGYQAKAAGYGQAVIAFPNKPKHA